MCRGTEIARHGRSYGQGVFIYDPLHYLALIEMKPNALDQAAALQGWDLPEGFQHLRHLLEARMGNRCLLYTSPSPRDGLLSRMPSSA